MEPREEDSYEVREESHQESIVSSDEVEMKDLDSNGEDESYVRIDEAGNEVFKIKEAPFLPRECTLRAMYRLNQKFEKKSKAI